MNANRPEPQAMGGIIWHSGALADMEIMMTNGFAPARSIAALYYPYAVETG